MAGLNQETRGSSKPCSRLRLPAASVLLSGTSWPALANSLPFTASPGDLLGFLPQFDFQNAAAFTFFKTPSGNTGCAITGTSVRCDLLRNDAAKPPRPASCDFEWGNSFGLDRTGRARRLCNSDTVFDPGARVLAYGSSIKRRGIKCTSRESGLRCKNRSGHGFKLSRQSQKLF